MDTFQSLPWQESSTRLEFNSSCLANVGEIDLFIGWWSIDWRMLGNLVLVGWGEWENSGGDWVWRPPSAGRASYSLTNCRMSSRDATDNRSKHLLSDRLAISSLETTFKLKSLSTVVLFPLCWVSYLAQKKLFERKRAGQSPISLPEIAIRSSLSLTQILSPLSFIYFNTVNSKPRRKRVGQSAMLQVEDLRNLSRFVILSVRYIPSLTEIDNRAASSRCAIC